MTGRASGEFSFPLAGGKVTVKYEDIDAVALATLPTTILAAVRKALGGRQQPPEFPLEEP